MNVVLNRLRFNEHGIGPRFAEEPILVFRVNGSAQAIGVFKKVNFLALPAKGMSDCQTADSATYNNGVDLLAG